MAALIRSGLSSLVRARNFPTNIAKSKLTVSFDRVNHKISAIIAVRSMATNVAAKDKLLDDINRRIDYNQGISTQLFESLRDSLEEHGTLEEQDVGLMLHICSMGPFDCPTSKRLQFVDEVWSKVEKHGISPSTMLYNIKLKAFCKNKKDFNALDELMNMKALGLNPDKVTYSLLIEGFCLKGDISGANSVLEAMKTAQLTINVVIFNSFITGHLKAGSPEEASQVLELISSSGLNPNSQTYYKFASFYAEEGDMDSVAKYINEAEEQGIPFDHSMLLDLHRAMVTNGHSAAASKLLQLITEKGIFSSSFMQVSCHLVADGYVDAAFDLYSAMPKVDDGKLVFNSGTFLVKSMIVNGHNAQDIFNTADKVVEISPRSLAHRNSLFVAYKAGQTDLAVELLELMISKNHTIKVPYITPAICGYQKENNVEGVYKATELLLNLPTAGIKEDKLDQLMRCCYPALLHLGQSREDIVARFKQHEKLWNSIFFLNDVHAAGFDVALSNAEGKQLDGLPFQWPGGSNSFLRYLPQQEDLCLESLAFIHNQPSVDQESFNYLTSKLVRFYVNQRDWSQLEKFLDGLLEKKLSLVQTLKQISILKDAPSTVMEKFDRLCVGTSTSNIQRRSRASQYLSMEQLEGKSEDEIREYLKKNPDQFLPRLVLLQKTMNSDDLESTKQILREMQALGFSLSLGLNMKVISKLTQLKETEMALFYFDELKKLTGDSFKATIPLMIGEEFVKQGKIEGALEMISAAKKSQFSPDTRTKLAIRSILSAILENAPTVEEVSSLHSAIFHSEPIIAGNDAMPVHRSYIKRMSAMQDESDLVNTVLNVYQNHHIFPLHDFVLQRLIKKKDVENLKKVMDIGNAAFGSNFFHHKLAFNFIRCGMAARGATILKTPGLKINERVINSNCQYMIKDKEIDALESMVNVMKEMPVSQATMLTHLVEGYVSIGNLKQATEAVQQFALDYNDPPKKTIEIILRAYKSSNEDAPEVLQSLLSKCNETSTQSEESTLLGTNVS